MVKVTGSQAVKADALHYRSDLLLNGAVLLALLLSMQGFHLADGLFAILLGFYILWSALRIGYEAIQTLLDRELPEDRITSYNVCYTKLLRSCFSTRARSALLSTMISTLMRT